MKQLPAATVRLLSSSQVITSVANVVKELMENSLDAEASNIDVKLENYGLDRIEIRDNGHGIKAADAPVMAVRHFTSKICSHEDLERLQTYGFRGEALGSICAVAEVSVTTKTQDDDVSTQYMLDFTGNVVSQKPSHHGQGTTVSALKLFRNLPVRRQYYSSAKKCKEELKKVQDLLSAYALVRPELRLTLVHNKVAIWQKPKVADLRSALNAVLGAGAAASLLPCHHRQEDPEIVLEAFLPKPGADYSTTSTSAPDKLFIFINGRPVSQKEILKLVRRHYTAQYPQDATRNRYPILVLKVAVPPSSLDVNLTPDKTQVLLHEKEAVLTAVEALLVSLYGYRTENQPAAGACPSARTPDDLHLDNDVTPDADLGAAPERSDSPAAAPLSRPPSNTSSSSSVAEDWLVNPIPGALEPCFSFSTEDSAPPDGVGASDRGGLSAESWSRGTALTDPATGKPLQPVRILQPGCLDQDESRDPGRKPFNIITEKKAALTAFDLISNRTVRAPLSPAALFEKEARAEVLREQPAASLQDISVAVNQRWKNLREEERQKYEEKAQKQQELHERRTKKAFAEHPQEKGGCSLRSPGQKRKAPSSNQQLLDQLFSAQPQKKTRNQRPSQPLPCNLPALRMRLQRLSSQSDAAPRGLRLVNRLASQSAWVILCGWRLMLLNPFRVEETLLFKRLLEDNILPAVSLQSPIQLTDGSLGGAEYTRALRSMERQSPELDGSAILSDPRLVANGFKIRLIQEGHLEVTAMADCVPFLGVEDLREILTAVLHGKARSARDCRPLKVTNYLQSEAVRLARQLPARLSRDDVQGLLRRMEQQLGENNRTCFHGRPFLEPLSDVPRTDQEARALLANL